MEIWEDYEIVTRDVGSGHRKIVFSSFEITFIGYMLIIHGSFFSISGLMFGGAQKIRMLCFKAIKLTCSIWLDPNCLWAC